MFYFALLIDSPPSLASPGRCIRVWGCRREERGERREPQTLVGEGQVAQYREVTRGKKPDRHSH